MFAWILISVLMVTGWIFGTGWGFEHTENVCLGRNVALLAEQREGPLQVCR